jgi:hypothetical protein
MLFILVMDVLNSLISKASERELLQPILRRGTGQRVSIYADDVVMFLQPHKDEMTMVREILRIFWAASGPVTNIRKSSVTPIRCEDHDLQLVQHTLPCSIVNFPCRYLGLPLSIRKLAKNDFQLLIDKIADYLPGWKASLMHPPDRVALIRAVLTAVPIHHFIAVNCPKWVHKAIKKIIRAFLWKGLKEVQGGHCLIGWQRVCRPRDLGGLRILNLELLGWELQLRWLWMRKTQPDMPWTNIDMQVHANVSALFAVSVVYLVGDGKSTNFWADWWLQGKNIQDLAPALRAAVPNAIAKKRTTQEALEGLKWIDDIRSSLQAQALLEFLLVWDILQEVQLNPGVPNHHYWTPSSSRTYSSKSAYDRFFTGAVQFEPAVRIWKSWALPRCKIFLWLAFLNRCWTVDRLAHQGLDHTQHCLFCDQEEETIQHILVGCVFSKDVWF